MYARKPRLTGRCSLTNTNPQRRHHRGLHGLHANGVLRVNIKRNTAAHSQDQRDHTQQSIDDVHGQPGAFKESLVSCRRPHSVQASPGCNDAAGYPRLNAIIERRFRFAHPYGELATNFSEFAPFHFEPASKWPRPMAIASNQGNQAMTIVTKSALAAAILAVMAVSAHAQQGPSRQIQVLPAPGQQAQLQQPQAAAAPAPAQAQEASQAEAPAPNAAPAPAPEVAPKAEPKLVPAPAPKFAEPKFIEKPARKAYGYAGYSGGYGYGHRAPNCH